jgi:hypothetical protein
MKIWREPMPVSSFPLHLVKMAWAGLAAPGVRARPEFGCTIFWTARDYQPMRNMNLPVVRWLFNGYALDA